MTQQNHGILHLLVIGFHHRKGSIVESVYPPIPNTNASSVVDLPDKWRFLPALAMPDGAHNYTKDIIYFTLPSLLKRNCAVYGIACYRQVASSTYSNPQAEITRNTVQKSIVVLLRFPLFSYVAHRLSIVTSSLFETGTFTEADLRTAFSLLEERVTSVLGSPTSYQNALYSNLSVANFIRVYGRDALVLFKLLLLERRVLFDGDSAGHLSTWMLTLISLVPEMMTSGLNLCSTVDATWVKERTCWPLANLVSVTPLSASSSSQPEPISVVPVHSMEGNLSAPESAYLLSECTDRGRANKEVVVTTEPNGRPISQASTISHRGSPIDVWPVITETDLTANDNTHEAQQLTGEPSNQSESSTLDPNFMRIVADIATAQPNISSTVWDALPQTFDLDSPFPTDTWGFPVALFNRSYLLPLYLPLGCLDSLLEPTPVIEDINIPTDRQVRGFLAGATNPILRNHKQLADVIVTSLSPNERVRDPPAGLDSSCRRDLPAEEHGVSDGGDFSGGERPQAKSSPRFVNLNSASKESPKRSGPTIRLCAPSVDRSRNNLRATPAPLSRALQLSKLDRFFIDELNRVVHQWYIAQSIQALTTSPLHSEDVLTEEATTTKQTNVQPTGDAGAPTTPDIMQHNRSLSPEIQVILNRFPDEASLDSWLRQQFLAYFRALLLTAEGYNKTPADFNPVYLACLRVTHFFLMWRNQFSPSLIFFVSKPTITVTQNEATTAEEVSVDSITDVTVDKTPSPDAAGETVSNATDDCVAVGHEASAESHTCVATVLAQHPGRRYAEPDDWENLVDGFKKFSSMAADHGRRLMNQGVSGLLKFSHDANAQLRSSAASGVLSQISSAFKGLGASIQPKAPSNISATSFPTG